MASSKSSIALSPQDVVSFVLDNPRYDVKKPIYLDASDQSRFYSHQTATQTIRQLVAGFRATGFQQGDCVLINSMADIDYSILFLAVIAAGGVVCGANPYYNEAEFLHQFSKIKPKYIFTQPEFLDRILTYSAESAIDNRRIFVFDHHGTTPAEGRSWRTLHQHGECDWVRFSDNLTSKTTLAAFVMSSGTTGLPKAIVLSHFNIVSSLRLTYDQEQKDFEVRRLLCLPQFATAAIYSNHLCPLRHGEVCYVMPRFETSAFLKNIFSFAISEISLMPPMLVKILQSPLATKQTLKSLKYVHGGGSAIPLSLQRRMKLLLPAGTPFTPLWGLSEASGIGTCFFWPEDDDTGSIGRLLPGLEAKLIDEENNIVETLDTPGELCLRGPTVMIGYLDNTKDTLSTIDPDGWLRTGDICYCDSQTGKWYIVDRKKDLIKVNTFQVAPGELEDTLLQHEGISEAAVIGIYVPEQATELPRAYVVQRENVTPPLTEQAVKDFIAERLVKYKRLEGGVRFVESIPRAASGKLLKNILRDMAKREMGGKL